MLHEIVKALDINETAFLDEYLGNVSAKEFRNDVAEYVAAKKPIIASTLCNCGNPSIMHFCWDCLKTHDEYCKIPF